MCPKWNLPTELNLKPAGIHTTCSGHCVRFSLKSAGSSVAMKTSLVYLWLSLSVAWYGYKFKFDLNVNANGNLFHFFEKWQSGRASEGADVCVSS
jgi:hypothetical protein